MTTGTPHVHPTHPKKSMQDVEPHCRHPLAMAPFLALRSSTNTHLFGSAQPAVLRLSGTGRPVGMQGGGEHRCCLSRGDGYGKFRRAFTPCMDHSDLGCYFDSSANDCRESCDISSKSSAVVSCCALGEEGASEALDRLKYTPLSKYLRATAQLVLNVCSMFPAPKGRVVSSRNSDRAARYLD